MGIASRTKWEARTKRRFPDVKYLDPAKLAHWTRVTHKREIARSSALGLAVRIAHEADLALQALEAKRRRERRSRFNNGWQPFAAR